MTAPLCYAFEYCFHGVGQGLFASGAIRHCWEGTLKYEWVYDCGSSTDQKLLEQRLAEMEGRRPTRDRLHLVTLSHFDRDHISGVCELLRRFKVVDLLLPYMQLWKRLLIAFQEQISPTDDLFRFFINPVQYLASLEGSDIIRVIFVGSSGNDGPTAPDTPERPDEPREDNDRHWKPEFSTEEPEDQGDAAMLRSNGRVTVEFLKRGGALKLANVWEFVPYNDDAPAPAPKDWEYLVAKRRDDLTAARTDRERQAALDDLKAYYDGRFETSYRRNVISLFLYGGPIYSTWPTTAFFDGVFNLPRSSRILCPSLAWPLNPPVTDDCSVLYSGDGYLNTPTKLDRLLRFFGRSRLGKLAVFQVMHHGSKANWRNGVAASLAPQFSIFSSDPHRNPWYHPHAQVWRDFSKYNPVQVSDAAGAVTSGVMCA